MKKYNILRKKAVILTIFFSIGIAVAPGTNASPSFCNLDEGNASLDDSDLFCWGELVWSDVQPGETVHGRFYLRNEGEQSDLYWEITEWPEWGIWDFGSFFPKIPPGGLWIVFVNVTAPNQENVTFTGYVKVVNTNNESDFCIINASLATNETMGYNVSEIIVDIIRNRHI